MTLKTAWEKVKKWWKELKPKWKGVIFGFLLGFSYLALFALALIFISITGLTLKGIWSETLVELQQFGLWYGFMNTIYLFYFEGYLLPPLAIALIGALIGLIISGESHPKVRVLLWGSVILASTYLLMSESFKGVFTTLFMGGWIIFYIGLFVGIPVAGFRMVVKLLRMTIGILKKHIKLRILKLPEKGQSKARCRNLIDKWINTWESLRPEYRGVVFGFIIGYGLVLLAILYDKWIHVYFYGGNLFPSAAAVCQEYISEFFHKHEFINLNLASALTGAIIGLITGRLTRGQKCSSWTLLKKMALGLAILFSVLLILSQTFFPEYLGHVMY